MPNKVRSFDEARKKRLNKMSRVMPANLKRARKYRSSGNWQTVRAMHMRNEPLCYDPFGYHKKEGGDMLADQVHHIQGLATHYHLRALESNLASICTRCHSVIEQMERHHKSTTHLFR